MPEGWHVRPACMDDLPELRRVYDEATQASTGAAVRSETSYAWRTLRQRLEGGTTEECWVVQGPDGRIGGYARQARGHWAVDVLQRDAPDHRSVGEAIAIEPCAADTLIAWLLAWGSARPEPERLPQLLPIPHDCVLAAACMRRNARFIRAHARSGGSMARLLDPGKLLSMLHGELDRRLRRHGVRLSQPLQIVVEERSFLLHRPSRELDVEEISAPSGRWDVWRTTASDLVRLALGALPPEDVLQRSAEPPSGRVRHLVETLFPLRCPHMYLPDRY